MNDRLYRSRDDRVICGVCAGLAERLDLDPALVRIGWVVLTILTGGLLLLLYIVMLVIVPEEPGGAGYAPRPPEPGAVPGWVPPAAGASWTAPSAPRPGDSTTGWTPPGASGPVAPAETAAGMPADSTPAAAPPSGGWVPPAPMSRADARAARRAARHERRRSADPVAGLVFGAILVLLGLYFLAQQYLPELDLGRFWPVIVIGVGVILIARAFYRPSGPDA